jgi:hypothetical protein
MTHVHTDPFGTRFRADKRDPSEFSDGRFTPIRPDQVFPAVRSFSSGPTFVNTLGSGHSDSRSDRPDGITRYLPDLDLDPRIIPLALLVRTQALIDYPLEGQPADHLPPELLQQLPFENLFDLPLTEVEAEPEGCIPDLVHPVCERESTWDGLSAVRTQIG